MARNRNNDFVSFLRSQGLRKRVARALSDLESGSRDARGNAEKLAHRVVNDLRSAAEEIEKRLNVGGSVTRSRAAKKAATTRKRAATKRSSAAKRGAATRARKAAGTARKAAGGVRKSTSARSTTARKTTARKTTARKSAKKR